MKKFVVETLKVIAVVLIVLMFLSVVFSKTKTRKSEQENKTVNLNETSFEEILEQEKELKEEIANKRPANDDIDVYYAIITEEKYITDVQGNDMRVVVGVNDNQTIQFEIDDNNNDFAEGDSVMVYVNTFGTDTIEDDEIVTVVKSR